MPLLTPKKPSRAPNGNLLGAVAAAAGGDSFVNTGREFFYVKNGGAAPITVTFDSPGTCDFDLINSAQHDLVATIAVGEERLIGTFLPLHRFNGAATGQVSVGYSAVTGVLVAVLSI